MAVLISSATGNLTAASWSLVDSTSLLDSEAASTVLTTSYVLSSTFTPGAITTDGIAIKQTSVSASPVGTVSVALDQGGSTVPGTEVTIDVSDMPTQVTGTTTNEAGWIFFKFSAPVLLAAATAYSVKAKTSNNTMVNLYRDATTGNWSRLLRTTTTQSPAAGDIMHVIGEHTGSGTGNNFTITMDQTTNVDYGSGTDGSTALSIGKRGTMVYDITGSTYLKLSGNLIGYNGGRLDIGSLGAEIPRAYTAVLEFDPVADGGMGLISRNGFTLNIQGQSRTSGKNIVLCKLNTDEAIGQTTLGVDTDTGWLSGDTIVVGKTNRSASSITETKILNGDAGATSIDVTVGLATARSGTAPTQAHIGLLTRNVKVRGATNTVMAYVQVRGTSVVDFRWVEFTNLGENVANKRGIEVETTTGSFNMQYCSEYSIEDNGFATTGSTTDNIVVDDNIFYALNNQSTNGLFPFLIAATSGTNIHIRRNFFSNCRVAGGSQAVVNLVDVGIDFSNNIINDTLSGSSLFLNQTGGIIGTFDNNEISCSTSASAVQFQANGVSGVINGLKCWFNSADGINFNASTIDLTINDAELFGNANRNIFWGNLSKVVFNRLSSNSATTAATASGVQYNGGTIQDGVVFNDCNFSQSSGIKTAHTQEILMATSTSTDVLFTDCLLGAATFISGQSNMSESSVISVDSQNQTVNNHLWYTKYGIARSTGSGLADTTVRTSGSLGVRIAPTDSTTGFSWSFQIPAKANSYVAALGFLQKNAAFGTDELKVELFLPGSTVADATQTMGNTTGTWEVFNVAASYTGSINLYATVKITAKTTTSNAYVYVDDIYNGTNVITALDVWNNGQPSPIMFEQLGDALAAAQAVWGYATSNAEFSTSTSAGYHFFKRILTKIGAQIWT